MAVTIGAKAPNFTLRDSDKNVVSLKDFMGQNVLMLFFPAAFTSVCHKELCMMRDSLHDYKNMDAQVIALSVDSVFVLDKWKKEEGFNFTMLSDFNKSVSKKYGAFYKDFVLDMKGVSKRAAFVIDKKGVVKYAEILENAGEIPNFEAVKAALETA